MPKFKAKVDHGQAMHHLSLIYSGDPICVIADYVQNAIDENAKKIDILIDFDQKRITVQDNGNGVDFETMQRKFENICISFKDQTKLGELGIGNITGLSIAQEYSFVSKDPFTKKVYRLATDRDMLFNQTEIHYDIIEDLNIIGTSVTLKKVEKTCLNKIRRKPDALVEYLASSFYVPLKKNNINLTINLRPEDRILQVKAKDFPGQSIKAEYPTLYGKIIFDFYFDSEKHRDPSILIEYRDFSVDLLKSNIPLNDEVKATLLRGYVQGRIKLEESLPLKITPDRKSFIVNDVLELLGTVIAKFCFEKIEPILQEFEDEVKNEKRARLAKEVLNTFKDFLRESGLKLPKHFQGLMVDGNDEEQVPLRKPRQILKDTLEKTTDKPGSKPESQSKKQRGEGEQKGKPASGLAIDYYSDDKSLNRSKFQNGIVWINAYHKDYRKAEKHSELAEKNYIALLFSYEVTKENFVEYHKIIFANLFLGNFMDLYQAFI